MVGKMPTVVQFMEYMGKYIILHIIIMLNNP